MSRGSSRFAYASLAATARSTSSATRRTGSRPARWSVAAAPCRRPPAAVVLLTSAQDRPMAAQPQAASPVGGWHPPLGVLLHVTQFHRHRRGADQNPIALRPELARPEGSRVRAALSVTITSRRHRPHLEPGAVELGPGARLGR